MFLSLYITLSLLMRMLVTWKTTTSVLAEELGHDILRYDDDDDNIDDVEIYVGTNGKFRKENDFDEDDGLYWNDKTFLERGKRGSRNKNKWHLEVDGWVREGDDEVFLHAEPWMNDNEDLRTRDVWPPNTMDDTVLSADKRVNAFDTIRQYYRGKRDETGEYSAVIDLLIIVDNAIYREALRNYGDHKVAVGKLKTYYTMLASLVDIRYSQIDDISLNIRVRLSKLFIAKDRKSSPWAEYNIRMIEGNPEEPVLDPNTALNSLKDWLIDEDSASLKGIQYDHAMAFTGYQLVSEGGTVTAGMAFIGTICQTEPGYSTSLIAEEGAFLNVGTAVHELAHSLGARHDGSGDNKACPPSNNYIMAPFNTGNPDVLSNYFRFSTCSLDDFKSILGTKQAACLHDSDPDDLPTKLPGQIYTPDKQCRDLFGPNSGVCTKVIKDDPEQVCVQLWCTKPTDNRICITNVGLSALYGTPCGKNKICKQGQCVENKTRKKSRRKYKANINRNYSPARTQLNPPTRPSAPCRRDTNPRFCYQLVARRPDACDRKDFQAYCCYSCYHIGSK